MTIRVEGQTIFEAEDISVNVTSDKILLAATTGMIIQVEVTGSPDGFIEVEASAEMTGKGGTVIFWSQLHQEAVATVEDYLFFLKDVGYKWVRLKWVANPGSSGTIGARYTFKGDW